MNKKTIFYLLLILLLAAVVRLPGLWWGHGFFGYKYIPALYPDEALNAKAADELVLGQADAKNFSPPALGSQIALFYWLEKTVLGRPLLAYYDLGRLISAAYGLATIVVVFCLARRLGRSDRLGLLAALFLSLANLHITYSHIAHTDSTALFFVSLSFLFSLKYWQEGDWSDLAVASFAAGVGWIAKFSNIQFWPLFLILLLRPARLKNLFLVLAASAGGMAVFSGLNYPWFKMVKALGFIHHNLTFFRDYNRLFNLVFVPAELLVGLGLPVFALAAAGLVRLLFRQRGRLWRDYRFWLLGFPLLIFCLQSFAFTLVPARYFLPLLPALAILAAYALLQVKRPAVFWTVLAAILVWQALAVAGVQRYFVRDPRDAAGRWLLANVPTDKIISKSQYAFVPDEFRSSDFLDEEYLVLAEQGYRKYLFVNNLSPLLAGRYPVKKELYHPDTYHDHDQVMPRLFQGLLPYRVVKRFPLVFWTPEQTLWRRLGYVPDDLLGDVLIWQRTGPAGLDGSNLP